VKFRTFEPKRSSAARTEGALNEMGGSALADTPGNTGSRFVEHVYAHVAQLAEHALGKGEVSGSIPDMGSRIFSPTHSAYGR
jgi:hypothetical protein